MKKYDRVFSSANWKLWFYKKYICYLLQIIKCWYISNPKLIRYVLLRHWWTLYHTIKKLNLKMESWNHLFVAFVSIPFRRIFILTNVYSGICLIFIKIILIARINVSTNQGNFGYQIIVTRTNKNGFTAVFI